MNNPERFTPTGKTQFPIPSADLLDAEASRRQMRAWRATQIVQPVRLPVGKIILTIIAIALFAVAMAACSALDSIGPAGDCRVSRDTIPVLAANGDTLGLTVQGRTHCGDRK